MSRKSRTQINRENKAKVDALLEKANKVRVTVYTGDYINPGGPSAEHLDDEYEFEHYFDDRDRPTYEDITVKEFIAQQYIQVKPNHERCYGFLDVNISEVEQWLLHLESGMASFEICNYDTINCYKLELVKA